MHIPKGVGVHEQAAPPEYMRCTASGARRTGSSKPRCMLVELYYFPEKLVELYFPSTKKYSN
jgi:hypothetical protein